MEPRLSRWTRSTLRSSSACGGERLDEVRRVHLTASGGPFRTRTLEEIHGATPEEALAHPNWDMGPRVTIGSATLMNKGP